MVSNPNPSRHAAALDAAGFWRQFPATVSFVDPIRIAGVIESLNEVKIRDEYLPKLRIRQDDGVLVIVTAGQARLLAELVRLKPAVGDRITIDYRGEADRAAPGMNRTKEFTVTVDPPPGRLAAAKPTKTKAPAPVAEPVTDPEYQTLLAARLSVTERARNLPVARRPEYLAALAEQKLPENPAERSVNDCDAIWEILDRLDCPPIPADDAVDEPF